MEEPEEKYAYQLPVSSEYNDLVSHIQYNASTTSPRWNRVKEGKHSTVWLDKIKKHPFDGVRTTCDFAVPAPLVLTYFLDSTFRSKWDSMFDHSTLLEEIDEDTAVWHMVFKSPIPLLKPRDVVIQMRFQFSEDSGRYVIEYHSVEHPGCPANPGMVRAAIMPGSGATITPLDVHGSPSPTLQTTMCQATQVEYLDFKGKIPMRAVNTVSTRLASSFDKFRKMAEKRFRHEQAEIEIEGAESEILSKKEVIESEAASLAISGTFPSSSPAMIGSMSPVSPKP
ncbi:START domain [Carpediemonas membranifera]|uniref:START domain n=1 Tax=Carpediemonas membranifera TaxID=201153 RepID=A0A8J6E9W2_9EUKA|nr:START domain [Carpediemonas membranifera]|eukprot:KAG9393895.1 START domain [Carpediemonas membranifera]